MIDVSTLSIAVKSDGIKEATTGMEALAVAASKVDKSLLPLVASNQKAAAAEDATTAATKKATDAATAYIAKLQMKADTMGKSAAQTAALTAAQNGFSAGIVKQAQDIGASIDAQAAAMERANSKGSLFNNTVKSMISAFILYQSVGFAKDIIAAGDAWMTYAARLKIATGGVEEAATEQAALYDMAQKIRVPLESVIELYARLAIPMKLLGKNSSDTNTLVEALSISLKLSGATAEESSSAMIQFSQAMAQGHLQGQELNSVSKAAPIFMQAMREELVRTGAASSEASVNFKKLGAAGSLTAQMILDAAKNALPALEDQFQKLPVTVNSAMTDVKNAWVKAMGEMSTDTSLNKNISKALADIVAYIPTVAKGLGDVVSFITENFKGLAFIATTLIAMQFASWMVGIGVAITGAAEAVGIFGTAMKVLATVLGTLPGPLGLIIAAVGLMYTAYKLWFDSAPKDSATTTTKLVADTETRISALRREIDTINEKYDANSKKVTTASAVTDPDELAHIANLKIISDLQAAQKAATNQGAKDGMQISIDQRKADDDHLMGLVNVRNAVVAANALQVKTAKQSDTYNTERKKYDKDYANQQKIDAIQAMDLNDQQKQSLIALATAKFDKSADDKAANAAAKQVTAMANLNSKLQDQLDIKAKLDDDSGALKTETANEKALNKLQAQEQVATGIKQQYLAAQVALQAQVVAQEKLNTAQKNAISLDKATATQNTQLGILQQNYDLQLKMLSLGDKEAANQQQIFSIQQKYSQERTKLDEEYRAGTAGDYAGRLALIQTGLDKELSMYKDNAAKKTAIESDWSAGASKAIANYVDAANNKYTESQTVFNDSMKGMEDALVNFTLTGKLSFSALATSIITDIARIQAKNFVASLMGGGSSSWSSILGGIVGAVGGTSGQAVVASAQTGDALDNMMALTGSFGTATAHAKGGAFDGGVTAFATGGAFTNSVVSQPTNFNMGLMGEAGPEAIMPLSRTSDGSLGVAVQGGGGSSAPVVTYAPVIHIDSRTDRADIEKLVNNSVKAGNAKLVDDLQRARRL